ncbi:hypothetical protein CS022_19760 [Veronia nyctiphanis]|uniref:Uncharacterized protein n=1 Tax=Veronia nyctiphanis TaxID=1278244 RepID=A0A4Q0YMY2_9GAMM|nr:hypothetical protein CS022_19760 [Veronia nyctiphanis]
MVTDWLPLTGFTLKLCSIARSAAPPFGKEASAVCEFSSHESGEFSLLLVDCSFRRSYPIAKSTLYLKTWHKRTSCTID